MSRPSGPATPVRPTAGSGTALWPLAVTDVRITGGPLAARQAVNRAAGIPAGGKRLHDAGNLDNLRAAAQPGGDDADGEPPYHGPLFMDSDVYKWLEAVAWEYAREPAPELLEQLREVAATVAAAQESDGYLNSYVQVTRGGDERYRDLAFSHELYCLGHLVQAAVAARRATGDEVLWGVAVRAADHLVTTFGPEANTDIDGHPVVEMALVELFRETGDDRYLDLAAWFVDRRGHRTNHAYGREPIYFSDRVPARDAETVEGHAVRAMYFAAGVRDVASEGRDPDGALAAAGDRQWAHMLATKTYLTGGLGSRWDGEAFGDPYELPPDVAYCETCAAIGAMQWSWRRLLAAGRAGDADLVERILFNGFLSGVSLSGDEFFYVNALQVRSGAVPDDHRQPANGRHGWYQVACCPPNVMRTVSSLSSLLATTDAEGVQLHQYAPVELTTDRGSLRVETDYPWDGTVVVTVLEPPDDAWTLALRVPGWCDGASVAVNNDRPAPAAADDGYVRVHRRWSAGDTVTLTLPMPVRLTTAHPRVDAVRGTLAVERGPSVYAIEQVDVPAGVVLDDLDLRTTDPTDLGTTWRPDLLGGVVTVTVPMRDRTTGVDHDVTAVPYATWANRGVGPMRVWLPVAAGTPR